MKIFVYGDLGEGDITTSYLRAFRKLGHDTADLDARRVKRHQNFWLRNKVAVRATLNNLAVRLAGSGQWNRIFLTQAAASRPDLIFIVNGEFLAPETLSQARRFAPVFVFHPDNPLPPHYACRPETTAAISVCDVYFAWSRSLMRGLETAGARRVEYLPFAWDPNVFPYEESDVLADEVHDVVFVGGWDKEREASLAEVARHFKLKIWGPDYWSTRARKTLRPYWQGSAIRGREAAEVLRRSKISINILRRQNYPDGTNMRTFELPGCGAFPLCSRTGGAVELLPEEEGSAYFGSDGELLAKIGKHLDDGTLRREVRRRGHSLVRDGHTYVDRARTIVNAWAKL